MKIEILSKILIILFISIFLKSCGGLPKAGDARTMEMEGEERARKNIEEGNQLEDALDRYVELGAVSKGLNKRQEQEEERLKLTEMVNYSQKNM